MNKRRARLCCDDRGRWTVERVLRWGDEDTIECRDEQHAREVLAQELADGDGWLRIDHLSRPPGQLRTQITASTGPPAVSTDRASSWYPFGHAGIGCCSM